MKCYVHDILEPRLYTFLCTIKLWQRWRKTKDAHFFWLSASFHIFFLRLYIRWGYFFLFSLLSFPFLFFFGLFSLSNHKITCSSNTRKIFTLTMVNFRESVNLTEIFQVRKRFQSKMFNPVVSTRYKVISRISREYTKMTADGIRTHAWREHPTYKALKSRQFPSGERPQPLGNCSRVFDRKNSHLFMWILNPIITSFCRIYGKTHSKNSHTQTWRLRFFSTSKSSSDDDSSSIFRSFLT